MAANGKDLRDELDTISRKLLSLASRDSSRDEFLRGVSAAILEFTGADVLDLWLEDRRQPYHWQALAHPKPTYRISSLLSGPDAKQWQELRDRPSRTGALLEQILHLADDSGLLARLAARTSAGSLWRGDLAMVPFEIDGSTKGVLRLGSSNPTHFTGSDIGSCESAAQLLGVAIASRRARAALTERVKELTCMYGIAQIAAKPDITLDDALQEIVELLPSAWQYPDIATARITLDERVFWSRGFEGGASHLSADILVQGARCGLVEVFYGDRSRNLDRTQLFEEAPFLEEEHHLIQGVARELTFIIERRRAEDERHRLQHQIRRADRLATIGQLAAGVAHELNEPLGNILGFAQLANKSPDLGDQTRRDLERIVTASLYAREIIKKLMFFSRQTPSQLTNVNVNKIVEDGLSLLEPRCAKAEIAVVRNLAPGPAVVLGDPAQLQQVLVNLVVNAIQAMADGGKLEIRTVAETETVRLIVEDTGVGISPENLESIFMPFFTTKDVGHGTGLGLAVVHGIVKLHGGSVQVDSKVGSGTRFEIRLPVTTAAVAENQRDDA